VKDACSRRAFASPADPPSSEVLGDGCPAAEQVGPQRLELLTEAQHGAEGLAVLVQTRVELLDVQQRLLVHELQELLGLFGHLGEHKTSKITFRQVSCNVLVVYLLLVRCVASDAA